jgi:acyl carrier protein
VKVNGHRIELGEIEIAINEHPDARESVITSSEGTLTAHVKGNANPVDLRAHLAAKLPAYMVPAEFLIWDAFPLTPNGKVDRNALAAKHSPSAPERPVFSGASLESRILALWSEILGKPVTDATANFFDLGGNSIHLAVVHVRLREMTGIDIPITDLFARPSARAIANHLSPRNEETARSGIQERARLAKAGFARFQRPLNR